MSGFSLATSSCVTSLPLKASSIQIRVRPKDGANWPIRRHGASSPLLSLCAPLAKHPEDFKTDPLPSAQQHQERAVILVNRHLVFVVLFRRGRAPMKRRGNALHSRLFGPGNSDQSRPSSSQTRRTTPESRIWRDPPRGTSAFRPW